MPQKKARTIGPGFSKFSCNLVSASFWLTLLGMDVKRLGIAFDHFAIDYDFLDTAQVRQLEHCVQKYGLHDRTQAARACFPADRPACNTRQGLRREGQRDILHVEQLLILLEESVLRLGQDFDQRFLIKIFQGRNDRKAPDEFRDKAKALEIFRLGAAQDFTDTARFRILQRRTKANRGIVTARGNDLVETRKGAANDEKDVRRVNLQEFLLRVLAPP